ncbi:MAG: EAL domain-containing protein [Clostridia bacterium]|nr:EAL domain-containing protein [Clostridia bacterium]
MKRKKNGVKQSSLFSRIILPFIALVIVIGTLLVGLLAAFGTFQQIHEDELHMLSEITVHQATGVMTGIDQQYAVETLVSDIQDSISRWLYTEKHTFADVQQSKELCTDLMGSFAPFIKDHLNRDHVSGVFVVLDVNQTDENGDPVYSGIYLREKLLEWLQKKGLLLMRGPISTNRLLLANQSINWQEGFSIYDDQLNTAFYQIPMQSYLNRASTSLMANEMGYWSKLFTLGDDGQEVITYSEPFTSDKGQLWGVAGVEMSKEYLQTLLTVENDRHTEKNNFILAITDDGGKTYQTVVASEALYQNGLASAKVLHPQNIEEQNESHYLIFNGKNDQNQYYAAVQPLNLYGDTNPFRNQQWVLLGVRDSRSLFATENAFRWAVGLSMALSLILGLILAYFVSKHIAGPIEGLMRRIRKQKGHTVLEYEATGITEVDELSRTICDLNRAVAEEASKISKIITLSNMPIGAFERKHNDDLVYCSDGFYMLLNCRELFEESNRMPLETFNQLLSERIGDTPAEGEDVFLLKNSQPPCYLRLRMLHDQQGIIGTLMDVTEEIEKRKRIEHERDYDLLTNRFNRRAFERNAQELFDRQPEMLQPVSAMLMMDMDNLKSINDTYGHDSGDNYIRSFADALDVFADEQCIIGRRSGDEFYVLFYGYASKEALMEVIQRGWQSIKQKKCQISDSASVKLGVSGGVALYPEHSLLFPQLLHYADFAMYCVKNGVKGSLMEFTKESYEKSGYLMNGIQALNKLLEQRLVRYAFQPIVSAKDASVLGYELLMRPTVPELPTPEYVLRLASQQGKLHQVEVMTWQKALESADEMRKNQHLSPNAKLFINSVASHSLSSEDEKWVEEHYAHLLPSVVLEITERETRSDQDTNNKVEYMRRFSAHVAIDDFGSGYNNEHSLVSIDADYVKLDMSFVRNVHLDTRKRNWLATLLSFTKKSNIYVIAEGVETLEELEVLCALGVDYYQGYYIARPDYDPPIPSQEVVDSIRQAYQKCHKEPKY